MHAESQSRRQGKGKRKPKTKMDTSKEQPIIQLRTQLELARAHFIDGMRKIGAAEKHSQADALELISCAERDARRLAESFADMRVRLTERFKITRAAEDSFAASGL
jgi:hypothetical protein